MNPLAKAWAERERARLERAYLRALAEDLRKRNREVEPLRRQAAARRKAGRRQDGPGGFIMVDSGGAGA